MPQRNNSFKEMFLKKYLLHEEALLANVFTDIYQSNNWTLYVICVESISQVGLDYF